MTNPIKAEYKRVPAKYPIDDPCSRNCEGCHFDDKECPKSNGSGFWACFTDNSIFIKVVE